MSISSSEKIFIDPREEIIFVVERLLKADKDSIILVVPQNSLLLSSLVSIDILFRKLVRTKKLAIIVSEDEYGKTIASKAGFVVVDKVSQITNEQWNLANSRKIATREILDERKKTLLSNISGNTESIEELPELPDTEEVVEKEVTEQQLDDAMGEDQDQVEVPVEETAEVPAPLENIIESELIEVPEETKPMDVSPLADAAEAAAQQKEAQDKEELESSLKKFSKPRREIKELDIDGIKLVSAGDIKAFIDSKESAKITDTNSFTEMSDINIDRKIKRVGSSSFTGKDFTKKVSDKGGLGAFFSKFNFKRRNPDYRDENDFVKKKNRKRLLLVTFVIFLFLFAGSGYVLAFQVSTVDVNLKLKAQDVSTSATVLISKTATDLSLETPITIPAKEYSIPAANLSISKTGTADGDAKRGAKAKGTVSIYNLETESIALKAGAKFKNLTNGLTYLLTSDVTLDSATVVSNVKNPSVKSDVAIEAEAFGTQYNIALNQDGTTRFSVNDYDSSTEVSATAFQSFTGGTEESFISVSQANYDKLKDTIVPDLKKQGLERLKALTDSGYQLIEGTVTYDETKAPEAFPKVGDEAKDKTFNLTVQIGIKGLAVKTSDLTAAITKVLKANAQTTNGSNLEVGDISDPKVDKVEASGDDFTLTVSSNGSVKTQITADQMKKDIAGLTMEQANDYFRLIDYIDSYQVSFNPGIVPASLRRVPLDTSRINIKTK